MKSVLIAAFVSWGLAFAWTLRAETYSDLDECIALKGEDVEVSGLIQLEWSDLTNGVPVILLEGGNLSFKDKVELRNSQEIKSPVKFMTDDYSRLPEGGVTLWRVVGGTVSGTLELNPPSVRDSWNVVVSDGGRVGRLVSKTRRGSLASVAAWFKDLGGQFHSCFIANQRWRYLTDGLLITLRVALCAVLLGALIGFFVAIVRSTHDRDGRFGFLNGVFKVYLTVIRGTPMAVQLLIAYFVIFASCNNKTLVAILAFGLNSGAYVAEIMRAGITSIDPGQMEAGRSLGLSYVRTMIRIILPQAFRNVLPALGNEFIVLLKDTSIASFIALQDLAKGGEIIRSQTYNVYMPFLMVAAVYLVLVMTFTWLLGKLERHLRNTGADVVHNDS